MKRDLSSGKRIKELMNLCNSRLVSFICVFLILMSLAGFTTFAQEGEITVTGIVQDPNGEPLIGVNVFKKRTWQGAVTDIDGKYVISARPDDELQFSFIGFKMQTVNVDGRTTIDITMEEDITGLEEVVVVGYGQIKRANLVGAVSSIKAEELEDFPVTSITSILDGKISGLSVTPMQPTGRPGADTRIEIRNAAANSLGTAGGGAKDVNPLYVVDGFIMSQEEFDLLDPGEIESISVLKDASAAVYGARGANGVILVKTKRGKEGKLRVSYSGSFGVADATQQTEMLSAYDLARMLNDRYTTSSSDYTPFSDDELEQMKSYDNNWLDDAWKLSTTSRHSINISGGSDKVRYYTSGTYVYTTGNFDRLDVRKYSYRLGLDADIIDNLTASITLAIDNKGVDIPYVKTDGQGNTMENVFAQLLQAPKWLPHTIDGNNVISHDITWNAFALFNSNSYKRDKSKGNTVNASLKYSVPFIEGLEVNLTYSRRENHGYGKQYLVPYYLYRYSALGESKHLISNDLLQIEEIQNTNRIYESSGYGEYYQINGSLNYNKTIGKHDISAFATYEQSESERFEYAAWREEQLLTGIETQNGFNIDNSYTKGTIGEEGRLSGVARLNYSYDSKYLVESTLRLESSTKFSPKERKGLFPSIALGWVISEESFIQDNLKFLNYLKLRASFGRTGVDYLGAYEYRLEYTPSGTNYLFGGSVLGGLGVQRYGVVSSGVSWEKNDMYNVGVDMKLFGNHLGVSADGFYQYKFDMLDQRTVEQPVTAGIPKMPSENLSRLAAWGYDMQIDYNGTIGSELRWNVKGIFSFYTNEVLEKPTQYTENDFRYPIGKSTYYTGQEDGYFVNGIIRTQEQLDAINAENMEKFGIPYIIFGKPAEVGMLYFKDIAISAGNSKGSLSSYEPDSLGRIGDGMVNEWDFRYITKGNDKFNWRNLLPTSLNMGASWKNLSINIQFNLTYGQYTSIVDKLARQAPYGSDDGETVNAPAFWSDYWTESNKDAAYPSPVWASDNEEKSTFWVRDAYQVRLRTLNISYKIPSKVANRLRLSSIRVYFAGTNLWTPVSTFDYKEDAIARFNTYPFLKEFNFGISVSL